MASKIGKRVFDWSRILARVPADSRGQYIALRAKYEALQTTHTNLTDKPTAIDWPYYQANISKSTIVADFKSKMEKLSIPVPKDIESGKIEDKKVRMDQEAVGLLEESKERIGGYKSEITRIHNLKPIEDMSMEEYLADKPELERKIDWEWENYDKVELGETYEMYKGKQH